MDNLEEMDRFLEKFNLPRLNKQEIEIMNKPVTNTEIKSDQKSPKHKQKSMVRWLHRRILSNIYLCLFNFYAEYIMHNARLDDSQAGIDCWEKYQQPQIRR